MTRHWYRTLGILACAGLALFDVGDTVFGRPAKGAGRSPAGMAPAGCRASTLPAEEEQASTCVRRVRGEPRSRRAHGAGRARGGARERLNGEPG